jgi:hypothetical protein
MHSACSAGLCRFERRHPTPARFVAALALACLVAAAGARADELRTHSGETLVGKVLEEKDDFVIFESAAFGRMTVPRGAISSLSVTPVPLETQPLPEEREAAAQVAAEQQEARQQAEREAVLSTDAVGRFLARINPLKGWKTRLGLGFIARRGSEDNDNDFTLRFQSERETETGDEHKLEARYYYAEDVLVDKTRTATDELLTGSYRYRHPLSDAFFFQARTGYYRDAIKELDHELTQTFGVGLRTQRERWSLSFTPAAGVQWRQVAGEETTKFVVGFFQELGFDITQTLKLGQTLDYLTAVDDRNDYSARFGVDLNQKLGAAWSVGLRYEYNYDSVVGRGASEEQERLTLNVGLEF